MIIDDDPYFFLSLKEVGEVFYNIYISRFKSTVSKDPRVLF